MASAYPPSAYPPSGPPGEAGARRGGGAPTKRQFVRFAFYKLDPVWRRLSADEQAEHKRELATTIETFHRRMLLRPYSLMGTRADAEILFWQIAESIEPFQEFAAAVAATRLGAYMNMATSYLSQTKRSIYEIRDNPGEDEERLIIQPSEAKYVFVYPFWKTRPWYKLPFEERQRMMDEHIRVGRKYASVKLNTTYSFGLDDQEFVLAFETDEASDFLDLVQDLRETDASLFTLRDTPLFSCINMSLRESLDALGGPRISPAKERAAEVEKPAWVEACDVGTLAEGARQVVYVNGQQVALFNVGGKPYAIGNRCPHARGPLSEGEVHATECTVTCPWHYAKFDLRSGLVVDGIAASPVETYATEIRDGKVFISGRPAVGAAATATATSSASSSSRP